MASNRIKQIVYSMMELALIQQRPKFRLMTTVWKVKENWLTKRPSNTAFEVTALMSLVLFALSYLFLQDKFQMAQWMPANPQAVLNDKQIWRLWTSLFAHGDLGHLLNNSMMFLPLSYLLTGYFGVFLFPVLGILMGGLINYLVLHTLPYQTNLIGMSGVVYWMGAVWLTLFMLIDTRKTIKHRFAITLFLAVLLFAPQTYKPEVSYLSHLIGFILGIVTGGIYYSIYRSDFLRAEVKVEIRPDDEISQSNSLYQNQDDFEDEFEIKADSGYDSRLEPNVSRPLKRATSGVLFRHSDF